ncbi:MAG: hypothetical protein DIU59_002750 [Pseudomonadota bacterium]
MSRTIRGLLVAGLLAAAATSAGAAELAARVDNESEPVLCAEKDNVSLTFTNPQVRHFRIRAVHPAYLGMLDTDRWAADWTSCDMSGDPVHVAEPRRVTFYETPDLWLVGYTYPSFWRPNDVPVRVGDRVEHGLHLIQVWVRHRERAEEVLVLYPPDGYWRARPIPPGDMRWTAYGSSFLVGPVKNEGRPIVALKEVVFDPATRTFTLSFADGGEGKVRLAALDDEHIVLDVSFSGDMPRDRPFAALRSMYVMETNADTARVAWRTPGARGWGEAPVMTFPGAEALELWTGRVMPSRHNTSAPDMIFGNFSDMPLLPDRRDAPPREATSAPLAQ